MRKTSSFDTWHHSLILDIILLSLSLGRERERLLLFLIQHGDFVKRSEGRHPLMLDIILAHPCHFWDFVMWWERRHPLILDIILSSLTSFPYPCHWDGREKDWRSYQKYNKIQHIGIWSVGIRYPISNLKRTHHTITNKTYKNKAETLQNVPLAIFKLPYHLPWLQH